MFEGNRRELLRRRNGEHNQQRRRTTSDRLFFRTVVIPRVGPHPPSEADYEALASGTTNLRGGVCPQVAKIVGIDDSAAMLEHARRLLPDTDFRVARLEDNLPGGRFDDVVSALAVHTSTARRRPTCSPG